MEIINKKDYDQSIKFNDKNIRCYTKKKLEELYPSGNYKIVGETLEKNNKKEISKVIIANKELIVSKYGDNNKIIYKCCGYFAVDDDEYIVLLKNRVKFLILLFLGLVGIGVLVYLGIRIFLSIPSVEPLYNVPPKDNESTEIENDTTIKSTSPSGGGSVRIRLGEKAIVDLNTGIIEMVYQNPNQSNKDAVITLVLINGDKEYTIARSGLIKSGNQISKMNLIKNVVSLSQGVYKGKFVVDHFDPITGEKAITNSTFSDIEIQVK